MKKIRKLKGVIPVLQTPLKEDLSIDTFGLKKLVKYLNTFDIGGYWALGTGSEDMNLTFKKRIQVAQILTETNQNVKPIVLGCGFYCMEDIKNFIIEVKDLDFESFHIMPYHPLLSDDRLIWFYNELADFSPKPIWMYHSSNWSKKISPKFVSSLKDHKNIVGIKFSSRDTIDQFQVISLKSEEFQVITAVINQFYASLSLGVDAGTSSLAGCIPQPIIDLYNLFINGSFKESILQQQKIINFTNSLPKNLKKDNFLGASEEKTILSLKGICQKFTSDYYRDTSKEEEKQIEKALKEFDF